MKYRKITLTQNQYKANELLKFFGITRKSDLPIDPETIIRKMGYQIVVYPGLLFRLGLLGGVVKINSRLQIWIDKKQYQESDSALFTLGEELGHIVLHLEDFTNISSIKDWFQIIQSFNEEHFIYTETQAKTFSSNILLPNFIFDSYTIEWVGKHLKQIDKLSNTTTDDLAWNIASLMAKSIKTSPSIIDITLKRWPNPLIGQITKQYPDLIRNE